MTEPSNQSPLAFRRWFNFLRQAARARMSYVVTDLVKQHVHKLFPPDEAELVIAELASAHWAACRDGEDAERVYFAVLHLSGGDLQKFDQVFRGGRIDWQEMLFMAGLAESDWPDVLRSRGIDFRGTYVEIVKEELRRGVA